MCGGEGGERRLARVHVEISDTTDSRNRQSHSHQSWTEAPDWLISAQAVNDTGLRASGGARHERTERLMATHGPLVGNPPRGYIHRQLNRYPSCAPSRPPSSRMRAADYARAQSGECSAAQPRHRSLGNLDDDTMATDEPASNGRSHSGCTPHDGHDGRDDERVRQARVGRHAPAVAAL